MNVLQSAEINKIFGELLASSSLTANDEYITSESLTLRGNEGEVFRLAVDKEKKRHLLIKLPNAGSWKSSPKGAIRISEQRLESGQGSDLFLDVECTEIRLGGVFEQFISDLLLRFSRTNQSIQSTVRRAQNEWRDLFLVQNVKLDDHGVMGIIGELRTLERLCEFSISTAIEAWENSSRRLHDFVSKEQSIESKSCLVSSHPTISISGVDQLDPGDQSLLLLYVALLLPNPAAPSIEERIEKLTSLGFPVLILRKELAARGYLGEDNSTEALPRFEVIEDRVWIVDRNFPALNRFNIGAEALSAVSRCEYRLDLDALPKHLSLSETEACLEAFCD